MRTRTGRMVVAVALAAAVAATATGCYSPTKAEWREYKEIKKANADLEEPYNPGLAAALNILPGIGNAYNDEWGLFALNLLFWPYSVLWGVPEAYVTARNKNVHEVLDERKYRNRHGDSYDTSSGRR